MDTHIHPDPGNTESGPLHVSLPEDVFDLERGKSDAGSAGAPQAPSASPEERLSPREEPRPPRRRGLLLGTAACLLVLGVGAAYVFSPYNTAYPVPMMASTLRQLANEAGIGQPAVLAPSAHLAPRQCAAPASARQARNVHARCRGSPRWTRSSR